MHDVATLSNWGKKSLMEIRDKNCELTETVKTNRTVHTSG